MTSKHIELIRQTYRCWNEGKGKSLEMSEHEQKKAERAKRVKLYRKSMEDHAEIDYVDIDEDSQYKFQMAFAKYCPAIATDELEEELLDRVPKPKTRFHKRESRHTRRSLARTYRNQREEKDLLVEVSKKEVEWK